MKLVIAEKPSVARDIGTVLNATKSGDGFISGNGYTITWAYGHLVGLSHAKAYGYEKWELNTLPIIPEKFKLSVNDQGSSRKQFNTVKDLMSKCTEIIVATDAGREGELIFRYIYNMSGSQKPFKRLWISSLTKSSILSGFNNLKEGTKFDGLYHAARCRNEADWILGINMTVAFTVKTQSSKPLSIGRVQTPVLAMICKRFIENKNFKSEDYFVPTLLLGKEINFKAYFFKERIFKDEEAHSILDKASKEVTCTLSEKKAKTDKQPLLFDLTTLQADANRKYGFSAQRTLDIAQKLYESKLITYPRTDSRYLTTDLFNQIPALLDNIFNNFKEFNSYAGLIDKNELPKRSINDKKVTDHHAIIPTGENQNQQMDTESFKLFELIVKRFIASFSPECKKEVTTYVFDELFKSTGTTVLVPGWRSIELDLNEDNKEDNQILPDIDQGEQVEVKARLVDKKKTKPKPIHSEASLLKLMETAAREIEDEELSKAIKDSGIGTPATRAGIIEQLIKRTYVERVKKHLVPTQLGLNIYKKISDLPIASPELTGHWEFKLNQMAQGSYDPNLFIKEISQFTNEQLPILIDKASEVETETITATCPKCKKGKIKERPKSYGCDQYTNGCDFSIWKTFYGKQIPLSIIETLIKTGKYNKEVKGFTNSKKEKFNSRIGLDENYNLQLLKSENKPTELVCPKCKKGNIVEKAKGHGCTRYNEDGCDFIIWKTMSSKNIGLDIVTTLVNDGITAKMNGFKNKNKQPFKAQLILDNQFKVQFKY